MNDRTQHIDHLIGAYVEDQLSRRETILFRGHIARCDRCRAMLARHEQLSDDLRLSMKHFPPIGAEQIDSMWAAIRQQRQPIRLSAITPKLIPVMASLILIAAIMVTPLFSKSTAAAATTSARLPEIDMPFIPTNIAESITAESIATPQPDQQAPVTPAIYLSPQYLPQAVPPTAIDHQEKGR
jgi:hypothetical protein